MINKLSKANYFPPPVAQAFYYDWRASVFYGLFQGSVLLFLIFIARKIQADAWQIALIASSPYIGHLATLFWSYVSTGKRKMPFIFWTKFIARASFVAMFFVTKPIYFVYICVLHYILEAGGSPAFGGFLKNVYPDHYRAEIIGYLRTISAAAVIATCFFVGNLLDTYGTHFYRYIFPIGGLMGAVSVWIFSYIKLPQETIWKEKQSLIKISQTFLKDKHILYLEMILFVAGFGSFMAAPLLPLFLVDELKISNINIGQLGVITSVFSMVTYLYLAPAMAKRNLVALLKKSVLLKSLVPLIYFFSPNISFIYAATIINGIAISGWDLGEYNYILQTAEERHVQYYSSLQFTFLGVRGVSASFIGIGLMKLVGLRQAFLIIFALMFGSIFLIDLYQKSIQKR